MMNRAGPRALLRLRIDANSNPAEFTSTLVVSRCRTWTSHQDARCPEFVPRLRGERIDSRPGLEEVFPMVD